MRGAALLVEQAARRVERQVRPGRVELVEPGLHETHDAQLLHVRDQADGREPPARRGEGHHVSDAGVECRRERVAEQHRRGSLCRRLLELVDAPLDHLGDDLRHGALLGRHDALERRGRRPGRCRQERLAVDRGCGADDARHLPHRLDRPEQVFVARALGAEHADVRGCSEDAGADLRLQPGHQPERDQHRHHADGDSHHGDGRDHRDERLLAARRQVAHGDAQLPGHRSPQPASFSPPSRPASGRMWGNRITSRIEGEPVSSIASRSIPTPQPPVGGRPCPSART